MFLLCPQSSFIRKSTPVPPNPRLEHQGPVNVVTYNHGSKYVLSGSSDRTIRLWNPSSGKEIKAYKGHAHEILALDMYVG